MKIKGNGLFMQHNNKDQGMGRFEQSLEHVIEQMA